MNKCMIRQLIPTCVLLAILAFTEVLAIRRMNELRAANAEITRLRDHCGVK